MSNRVFLGFVVRSIKQLHPKPLFVEQSSTDIWTQTCAAVREAMATAAIDPACVGSIGVDATCSLVAVGRNGQPVSVAETGETERDIIMRMDHRAAEQTAAINATQDPALAALRRHGTLPFGDAGVEMKLNAMNHGGHGEHGERQEPDRIDLAFSVYSVVNANLTI